jgi:N-acetylmuramic acid 6-phosphate etherase
MGNVPLHLARGVKGEGALRLAMGSVVAPRFVSQPEEIPADTVKSEHTEDHNLDSKNIDTLPSANIVDIIQSQDAALPEILGKAASSMAKAVDWITETLRLGGRIFYVGAGTSGRIAWMDAIELPPTFGIDSGLFEVILAGGREALNHSVEGAEDNQQDAIAQLHSRKLSSKDMLIGIAASGATPFVLAAVEEAKRRGLKTIGIACNERSPLEEICDLSIVAAVGPEVIAGSTRMKAGTATKMILNTLSTATMIRLGKVYDHWMIDVRPSNAKLRKRASRIIQGLTGLSEKRSRKLLLKAQGNAKTAILMAKRNISLPLAQQVLHRAGGNLRIALRQKN